MRAVIFDLGNVLVAYDHSATIRALAAVSEAGEERIATILAELGPGLGVGELTGEDLHQALISRAGTTRAHDPYFAACCAGMTPDPQALDYALSLQTRPDLTVAVISNTNEVHVAWLDSNVPQLAEIDLVIMSNEVHLAKPDPVIYELALELLDLPADRAIMIDDIAANVAGANAVGMAGILHGNWPETRAGLEAWLAG